ncbi:MAG TPA: hypothetical protein VEK73_14400 [Xanthobacteraceae bacterium]|nr:hypothetical protein [Xanthobacteraceae bacterium]
MRPDLPGTAEARDRPGPDAETGRVVQFRPRPRDPRPLARAERPPVEDIAKYERAGGDDDYRHRMIMNLIGFFACVLLVAAGIWIATAIAELRKTQDCILSGRRNCVPLDLPTKLRSQSMMPKSGYRFSENIMLEQ